MSCHGKRRNVVVLPLVLDPTDGISEQEAGFNSSNPLIQGAVVSPEST